MVSLSKPGIFLSDPDIHFNTPAIYSLALYSSSDNFAIAILDTIENKFVQLREFIIENDPERLHYFETLSDIFSNHINTNYDYKEIRFIFESGKSTLIPLSLYDRNQLRNYLAFNHDLKSSEEVISDTIPAADASTIFATPGKLPGFLEQKLGNIKMHHHSSVFIESIGSLFKHKDTSQSLFLDIGTSMMSLLQVREQKLVYFNSFDYTTAEDLVYYVLFVMEQLELNPEKIKLFLSGKILTDSLIYRLLSKYIRNVDFVSRDDMFKYSVTLDEVPEHSFFNLLNVFRCEL